MDCHPKHAIITQHAQARLIERVRTYEGFPNWKQMVYYVRYHGRHGKGLTTAEHLWKKQNVFKNNKTKVRFFKEFAFVFDGTKSLVLVTVLVVDVGPFLEQAERKDIVSAEKLQEKHRLLELAMTRLV